jgi:sporulation protein YlmC with PRC-barrel domain
MKHPNTKSDVAYCKILSIDGKKVGGVQQVVFDYDVDKVVTHVTLRMAVKKESVFINKNNISFETVK